MNSPNDLRRHRASTCNMKGDDCLPVSEDDIWSPMVGDPYKGRIYGMGTYYSGYSTSSTSMTRSIVAKDHEVRDRVQALSYKL